MLNADATTLGNHEFDRGVPEVVNYLKNLDSDVIVANLDDTEEPDIQGLYKKSKIVERNGRKIGLIGALVQATLEISDPGKLKILDEIESVKQEAERLRDVDKVDIVIVLSHCGLVIDREMARKGGSAIDVIVGGHSHSLLYNGTQVPGPDIPADTYPIVQQQENGHKVLIVQASAYTKYVGDLTVYFDETGEAVSWEGNTIFMDHSINPDQNIVDELKPWKEKVDEVGQRVIGEIKNVLYQRDCAVAECNIGNFVTDASIDYYVSHPNYQNESSNAWTYATIALTNAGGIRTSLPPGETNFDDLFSALPFQNTIDSLELQGKDLLDVLQISAEWWRRYNFLQVSGLKIVYNVTVPEDAKVVSVHVLCRECEVPRYEKLDPNRWYRILAPSFISGGGNGFTPFNNRRNHVKGDKMDVEVAERYLKKISPVFYKNEGRIVIIK